MENNNKVVIVAVKRRKEKSIINQSNPKNQKSKTKNKPMKKSNPL